MNCLVKIIIGCPLILIFSCTAGDSQNIKLKTEQRAKAKMLNDSSCTLIMRNLGNQDTLLRCIALLKESIKTDSSYSMAFSNIMNRYLEYGDTISAIKYLDLNPIKGVMGSKLLYKGMLLKKIKDTAAARSCFSKAYTMAEQDFKKYPDSADIILLHAMLLHYLGNEAKSKQETEILIQKYPEHKLLVDAWYNELKH